MRRKYTTYEDLLEFALNEADSFSLVWRNFAFDQSAFDFVDSLSPWLRSDFSSSNWPGTQLYSERARVKSYEVNGNTITVTSDQEQSASYKELDKLPSGK